MIDDELVAMGVAATGEDGACDMRGFSHLERVVVFDHEGVTSWP